MPNPRATLATVQRMVYENLGVSNSYGTLLSNARYPSDYINDRIAQADIQTIEMLIKNKQSHLLPDQTAAAGLATASAIPTNWHIISVLIGSARGQEIPIGLFETLNITSSVFDVSTYGRYYTIFNGTLYHYGGSMSPAETATVNYIELQHDATLSALYCPEGFEGAVSDLASAMLLMKRADKPAQAEFYMKRYMDFMQAFIIPDNAAQNFVND